MRARLVAAILGPRRIAPLSIAHGVAASGDACVTISLAGSLFFSVSPDASRQQVLTYLLVTMAPLAVLAPLVGPTVDRFRRRPQVLAAVCYVLRAAACLALAASLFQLSFYLFAIALLIINKASGVIKQALVPLVTSDPEQLVANYARLARMSTAGGAFGVALGGLVYRNFGAPWVLRLGALFFVGSTVAIAWLRPNPKIPTASETVEYAEMHLPTVVVGAIGFMAIRGAVGFFVFTMAFTLRRASEPTWVYGLALGIYGAGGFVGNVITPILRRRFREQTLLTLAISAPAALALIGALGVRRPMLLAIAALVGLSTTLGRHAFDALLQRQAPDALRGRAGARYETRFSLAYVAGAAVATVTRLPAEASVGILAAIYLPALVMFIRALQDARRLQRDTPVVEVQAAVRRLNDAEDRARVGDVRATVIDASAAVDLAQLAAPEIRDHESRAELEGLRRLALDDPESLDEVRALRALAIARELIMPAAAVAPTASSTPSTEPLPGSEGESTEASAASTT